MKAWLLAFLIFPWNLLYGVQIPPEEESNPCHEELAESPIFSLWQAYLVESSVQFLASFNSNDADPMGAVLVFNEPVESEPPLRQWLSQQSETDIRELGGPFMVSFELPAPTFEKLLAAVKTNPDLLAGLKFAQAANANSFAIETPRRISKPSEVREQKGKPITAAVVLSTRSFGELADNARTVSELKALYQNWTSTFKTELAKLKETLQKDAKQLGIPLLISPEKSEWGTLDIILEAKDLKRLLALWRKMPIGSRPNEVLLTEEMETI